MLSLASYTRKDDSVAPRENGVHSAKQRETDAIREISSGTIPFFRVRDKNLLFAQSNV